MQGRQSMLLIEIFMFINRKLFPSSQVKEDTLPFSLVWDTSQRHQGTKRIHREIKMSLGVLHCYLLQKKLSGKLMIFPGLSPNVSRCVGGCSTVHGKCCLLQGLEEDASKHVLPTQHNVGQGLVSAKVVSAVEGGIFCKVQRQDWTKSQRRDGSEAVQGSL